MKRIFMVTSIAAALCTVLFVVPWVTRETNQTKWLIDEHQKCRLPAFTSDLAIEYSFVVADASDDFSPRTETVLLSTNHSRHRALLKTLGQDGKVVYADSSYFPILTDGRVPTEPSLGVSILRQHSKGRTTSIYLTGGGFCVLDDGKGPIQRVRLGDDLYSMLYSAATGIE